MPIYEYECNLCHHQVEVMQKITEPSLKTCEACGKDGLEKLISQTAFQLKGGGWYSDLYGSSGAKKTDAGSDSKAKTESKPETKSEAKADTKPVAKKADAPAAVAKAS